MAQIHSNRNNNNSAYGKDPKGRTLIVPQGTWVPLTCLETFEVVASDSPPVIIGFFFFFKFIFNIYHICVD